MQIAGRELATETPCVLSCASWFNNHMLAAKQPALLHLQALKQSLCHLLHCAILSAQKQAFFWVVCCHEKDGVPAAFICMLLWLGKSLVCNACAHENGP